MENEYKYSDVLNGSRENKALRICLDDLVASLGKHSNKNNPKLYPIYTRLKKISENIDNHVLKAGFLNEFFDVITLDDFHLNNKPRDEEGRNDKSHNDYDKFFNLGNSLFHLTDNLSKYTDDFEIPVISFADPVGTYDNRRDLHLDEMKEFYGNESR